MDKLNPYYVEAEPVFKYMTEYDMMRKRVIASQMNILEIVLKINKND